jgi:hypothetical protein
VGEGGGEGEEGEGEDGTDGLPAVTVNAAGHVVVATGALGDAEQLAGLPSGVFGAVTLHWRLFMAPDAEGFLREVFRVLAPGGFVRLVEVRVWCAATVPWPAHCVPPPPSPIHSAAAGHCVAL